MTWESEYPTTEYRGPQQYPIPEDWVLNIVEADGVAWYRYDDAENGQEAEIRHDIEPSDVTYEGPTDEAFLDNEWNPTTELVTHKLSIRGESTDWSGTTIFSLTDPDEEVLWRAVAEALAKYARGEDFDIDPDEIAIEAQAATNESLAAFGSSKEDLGESHE